MKKLPVSLILPTFNEKENLEIIIPEIVDLFENIIETNYEILVVDDSSNDGTDRLVNELSNYNKNVVFISRQNSRSLPLSILKGITEAKYENVMWMDADGSMTIIAMKEIIYKFLENPNSVVIGSRFKDGGGYKGVTDANKQNIFKAISIVNKSEDSAIGMLLSIFINKILSFLFKTNLTDLTSGFIILRRNYINEDIFKNREYGEYFIYLVSDLISQDLDLIEVSYICETRKKGYSKTANSIFQIVKRGIPYFYAAWRERK
mgnify:FL=1